MAQLVNTDINGTLHVTDNTTLDTPLTIENGGTGATSVEDALTALGLDSLFFKAGDTIQLNFWGGAYITNSGTDIAVSVPIGGHVIGNPTLELTNVYVIVRQNVKYCYGGSATDWVTPASIKFLELRSNNSVVFITLTMGNTTNISNNSPAGLNLSAKLVLS